MRIMLGPLFAGFTNRRCSFFPAAALLCIVFYIGIAFISFDYKKVSMWEATNSIQIKKSNLSEKASTGKTPCPTQIIKSDLCERQCKPLGSETLPKGIVSRTSNLEMQSLRGRPRSIRTKGNANPSKSLLAMAVGIKQKEVVDQIVRKFFSGDFVIMLFHYDGVVDEWRDLKWTDSVLHVSAINQTKWWFAKRFLHPDIVAEYNYIFLWDEDLGVENFHTARYLSIIEREGLEISQPALDVAKSRVHHQITARWRRGDVHRRIYKLSGGRRCYENSTAPPCTGWVEMMAPVFSRAAWRCAWYMIQNDLIHAWGLDVKLGYCAQGDRSKKVGVVDSEYIAHKGLPTLGGFDDNMIDGESSGHVFQSKMDNPKTSVAHKSPTISDRLAVRLQSYAELEIFKKRWQKAVAEDKRWTDLYPES